MTLPTQLIVELREHRYELRIRQADLAERIGVSASALSRWEQRKADPTLGGLCAWAEKLSLDIQLVPVSAAHQYAVQNGISSNSSESSAR